MVYGDEALPAQSDKPKTPRTNPTSLPDEFLLSVQPIFQIRHPALMFPSMLRAQARVMEDTNTQNPRLTISLTLRPSRDLYDWYVQNEDRTGRKPRIIEADDIMNNPAAVRQLCLETGLDPDAVQYEWEERTVENPVMASFLTTINASKGIVQGLDSSNLDIEAEKVKWKKEFGEQTGEELAEYWKVCECVIEQIRIEHDVRWNGIRRYHFSPRYSSRRFHSALALLTK
jgi:hypothetical protein